MNVLMMNGSPNVSGNTGNVLTIIAKKIEETRSEDVLSEVISLSDRKRNPCSGCRACFRNLETRCPYQDDVAMIKGKMEEADVIVMGSPVYVDNVTGLTKNWIDRMAYNCNRPFLEGKPVYLITTSGTEASDYALRTMKNAFTAWGAQVILCDNYSMGSKMKLIETEILYGERIAKTIKEFMKYVDKKSISMHSLVGFQIQKKYWKKKDSDFENYDYEYWKEKGWLEKKCFYYRPIGKGFFKKRIAILLSKTVGKMIYT